MLDPVDKGSILGIAWQQERRSLGPCHHLRTLSFGDLCHTHSQTLILTYLGGPGGTWGMSDQLPTDFTICVGLSALTSGLAQALP